MVLNELLETLSAEERRLIYLRYFADRTQSDVGKIMGISQVQVSRMEKTDHGESEEERYIAVVPARI